MKKINFMPKDIRELLQLLEVIQRDAVKFPELQAQAAKLITIVKSMGRWMVCLDASKHAIIITWLATFACIVFEKYGAPRIESYSIPAVFAILSVTTYSMNKIKKQADNLLKASDDFKNISNNTITDILNYLSGLPKQK